MAKPTSEPSAATKVRPRQPLRPLDQALRMGRLFRALGRRVGGPVLTRRVPGDRLA